ncbi:MAG: glycosyltransferase family 4 protein [bacterium]|nr:glycosyltransferase family 4 protein [bacterium]
MDRPAPAVAYVIADPQLCGGVAVVCQHANRLARRGFDARIISAAPGGSLDWFPGLAVPFHRLGEEPGGIGIAVATWWETAHVVSRMDVPRKFYFVQSDESRFYGAERCERVFARDSYRFEFEFLTEARWIRRWLAEEFGVEARYVPNGVDRELFHPAEPLEPRRGRPRLLVEGPADMPSKGVADSFRALAGIDCEVWYVNYRGAPDPAWRIDRSFHAVPMAEMKRVYSSCDLLLKMSTVEGSPGPPLEMMACGGTCVVARTAGVEEGIEDGVNALVVEPGDTAGARRAVERLLADEALRRRLVEGGRRTVERLDWERSIDLLEEIFRSPPPGPARAAGFRSRLAADREAAVVEAYARFRETRDAAEREKAELLRALGRANDEINSIRHSKAWEIGRAFMEARHSVRALLLLPFRVLRCILR